MNVPAKIMLQERDVSLPGRRLLPVTSGCRTVVRLFEINPISQSHLHQFFIFETIISASLKLSLIFACTTGIAA